MKNGTSNKTNVMKQAFVPLSQSHPLLAAQWHPTKNGNVSPDEVWANYSKKFWWRCEKGHEWEARIRNRAIEGNGCSCCSGLAASPENSLAALYPEVAKEWHPTKNGKRTPSGVVATSSMREIGRAHV